MKIFAIPALMLALITTTATAQNTETVLRNATVSATGISGPVDFTLEANRRNITELEIGLTAFEHSYSGVEAALRFALGTDLRGDDTLYGRVEYNFTSDVADSLSLYGSAAIQYDTDTRLGGGQWLFDPSVGVSYDLSDHVAVFAEIGYIWELNRGRNDLGGRVEVGLPIAVSDSLYITPSVSRTFRTDDNTTAAHLNLTYQF